MAATQGFRSTNARHGAYLLEPGHVIADAAIRRYERYKCSSSVKLLLGTLATPVPCIYPRGSRRLKSTLEIDPDPFAKACEVFSENS